MGTMKIEMHRDIEGRINILEKAREGHPRSHAHGDNARPQREAVVEELKTCSA
jgi:transposase